MKRKLLVTHSLHQQHFTLPFSKGAILISWDGLPQALSYYYDVSFVPIGEVTIEDVNKADIVFLWFDDIHNPNLDVWDWIDDKVTMLSWQSQYHRDIDMYCPERQLIYDRLQKIDIILGVVTPNNHGHFFSRTDATVSNIINSIEFNTLYELYKDIDTKSYPDNVGVMPHAIEPIEQGNWSEFLLSMKVINSLGYKAGYQSRVYKDENIEFTSHLCSFGIDCMHFSWFGIHEYIEHLSKCKIMFEYARYDTISMAIVAALFGKLPAICSPGWYSQALFPDLVLREFDIEQIKSLNDKLQTGYRQEVIRKGYELAMLLDHQTIGNQLSELIEMRF